MKASRTLLPNAWRLVWFAVGALLAAACGIEPNPSPGSVPEVPGVVGGGSGGAASGGETDASPEPTGDIGVDGGDGDVGDDGGTVGGSDGTGVAGGDTGGDDTGTSDTGSDDGTATDGGDDGAAGCLSDADTQALTDEGEIVSEAVADCLESCVELTSECVGACLLTEHEISEGCADCFGERLLCLVDACEGPCGLTFDSEACGVCLDASCLDQFDGCAHIALDTSRQGPPTNGLDGLGGPGAICKEIVDCLLICEDTLSSCAEICTNGSPMPSLEKFWPYFDCLFDHCGDDPSAQCFGEVAIAFCPEQFGVCVAPIAPPDPVIEGACTGPEDQAIIDFTPLDLAQYECALECDGQPTGCGGGCLQEFELTQGCFDCFGPLIDCTAKHCGYACATEGISACYECQGSAGCSQGFQACAGVLPPGDPGDTPAVTPGCDTDTDLALWTTGEADWITAGCSSQCAGESAACSFGCLANQGFTAGCSLCLSSLVVCLQDQCDAQCAEGPGSSCASCSWQTGCGSEFLSCAEVEPPLDGKFPPPPTDPGE